MQEDGKRSMTGTLSIAPYNDRWPAEFQLLATALRASLADLAVRIDHIGSTSVPGLPAKDIIDLQITVAALEQAEPIIVAMRSAGYTHRADITGDHHPPGIEIRPDDWRKLYFAPPPQQRPTHVHVRAAGCANQRYPLLFRDYLRAHPDAAGANADIKRQLAHHHPDDVDAYYDIKDPVCDIIVAAAEQWATSTNWRLGPSDA